MALLIGPTRQPCVIATNGRLYYNIWLAVFTWGDRYTLKTVPKTPPNPPLSFSLPHPFSTKNKLQNNVMHDSLAASIVGANAHFRLYRYFLLWNSVVCLEPKGLQLVIACRPPVTGYSHVINHNHCIILCTLSKCPHAIKSKTTKQYFAHVEYSKIPLLCT